jgi:hypothetical protein
LVEQHVEMRSCSTQAQRARQNCSAPCPSVSLASVPRAQRMEHESGCDGHSRPGHPRAERMGLQAFPPTPVLTPGGVQAFFFLFAQPNWTEGGEGGAGGVGGAAGLASGEGSFSTRPAVLAVEESTKQTKRRPAQHEQLRKCSMRCTLTCSASRGVSIGRQGHCDLEVLSCLGLSYTQSSILRNTETAPTHQYVSYLNAFPRCDPSMPGRPCCRFQGGVT